MKILYAITRAELGGAQVHLLDLLKGFRGRYETHVATGDEGYLTEAARAIGVRCHILPELVHAANPVKDAQATNRFTSLIRELQPDLVHAHTTKAGLVARAAAWRCGAPAVFTAHSWAFSDGVSLAWKLMGVPSEWAASRVSARIINVSEANRRLAIRHGLPASRQVTIHNGISDTQHRARPDRAFTPEIIMVARFAPQKHHQLLLEAFAGVDTPATLTLVGSGPTMAWMRGLSFKLGIAGRVKFLGDRADVPELLARASVFALASRWEGFPLSILEAMRAGLPVVSSDVGGAHEAISNGENGYLVARGDTGGFRNALWALCRDPELRARMGSAARLRYEGQFSLRQMLMKTGLLYEQVWRERGIFRGPAEWNETRPEPAALREVSR
ncbi:MAG: glycosyltransferase family 4 protein [Bryobacteraceae bacterium]|nr:glycosyltransferase family 4 protein [Bryobacteraceae bacterium]